jgi:carboxyl-terminal processing protease
MKLKKRYLFPIAFAGMLGIGTITVENGKYFEIAKNIELYANVYKEINTFYVDDLDPARTMRIGIDAMLKSLDPFTNYISESEIEGYRFATEGKYNGIGATIQKIGEFPVITETYENCPAFKAGLKAGDMILSVDGQTAKGKDSDDVYDIMKGAPGSEMELNIRRPGESKDLKIKLKRDEVEVSNVPYQGMVQDDIGYVVLTTFTREAGANIQKAVQDLKSKNPNMKGLILDLRGNGGGLLNEAVDLVNTFVPRGELVVSTKGKVADWDRNYKTTGAPIDEKMPLTILVDKGSASASEIVSGALQDLDRGIVMGQRSYGKGLVQNIKDLGYNAKVKITTAKYYVPSGRCIQGVTYKDGAPVSIPDSLRTAFKTKNGRKVLDGGGILPDIYIDAESKSPVVRSLRDQFYIFDYVTEFALKNPKIGEVKDFHFTDFEGFIQYLEKRKFEGETESDKQIKALLAEAKKEKYDLNGEINALETKLAAAKKAEIRQYKKDIVDLIEKEIASRYYYEKGKIQMGLRNDKEIEEAVKVLRDAARYQKILKGK